MSGRIYDREHGIPLCKCGTYGYTSFETNFNGCYCPKCNKSIWEYDGSLILYDINHPVWKEQEKTRPVKVVYNGKETIFELRTHEDYKNIRKKFKIRIQTFFYELFKKPKIK